MRILVAGAAGFIGSHIARAAARAGHEVVAAARDLEDARRRFPEDQTGWTWVDADFARDAAEAWAARLAGVDAVVNAVGVLQGGAREDPVAAHVNGPDALYRACEAAGARRVLLISALGVDADTGAAFASTKREGEERLKARDLDWVVVRPSLVMARETFGGTTLLRALAGAPAIVPVVAADAAFQPLHADDLAAGVVALLAPDAPARVTLDAAGPETLTVADVIDTQRAWLGFRPARFAPLPKWAARPAAWAGDLAGRLGAPSALRSASLAQMEAAAGADSEPWIAATGVAPRALAAALAEEPAAAQDRIHTRLAFARPIARIVLGLFWLFSGLVALGPGREAAWRLLADLGFPTALRGPTVELGAALDVVLGAVMLIGWRQRVTATGMVLLTFGYVATLTVAGPGLWADPLGPILKVFPMMALAFVIAMTDVRR